MKTVEINCNKCNILFIRELREHKRSIKFGRPEYCSRKCACLSNKNMFGGKPNKIPPVNTYKANPFKYYMRNCKKRNWEFNLDIDYLNDLWIEQKGICPYTKVDLVLNSHSKRHSDSRYTASIDRIDSSKGYIKGNVQFVSMSINFMKNTLSHEKTIEFLLQISKNLLS